MKRKTLIQILILTPIVFIPAMVFFMFSLLMDSKQVMHEQEIKQLEQDYLASEKSRVRSKVVNMIDFIEYRQSIIDNKMHSRIQRRVEDAQSIAMSLYKHYVGKVPEDELKELIIESLRALTWNSGESYIWIVDTQGNLQLGLAI